MSYKYNEKHNRYDVTLYDKGKRIKGFSYSVDKYGKHAELMAKYSDENHIRLNNWFKDMNDYYILYCYYKPTNEYKEILISKCDYVKVSQYYWSAKKDSHGQEYYALAKFKGNKEQRLHRYILDVTVIKNMLLIIFMEMV